MERKNGKCFKNGHNLLAVLCQNKLYRQTDKVATWIDFSRKLHRNTVIQIVQQLRVCEISLRKPKAVKHRYQNTDYMSYSMKNTKRTFKIATNGIWEQNFLH